MKKSFLFMSILLVFGFTTIVNATPLKLEYSVTNLGSGLYYYDFWLILDNNDNSWISGQVFNWIIFGDNYVNYGSSPLSDFVGNSMDLPIGPFTTYRYSNGEHSGPTLLNWDDAPGGYNPWIPTEVGERLHWSGTSSANLYQGQLLFSNLNLLNSEKNQPLAIREVAYRVGDESIPTPTSEPATILLLGLGIAGMATIKRKLKK